MNFFQRQRQARSTTRNLVILFGLAVFTICLAVTLTLYLVFGDHEPGQHLFSAFSLSNNFGLISFSAIGALLFIAGASFFRSASLRSGGAQVARDLGGTRVSEDTTDLQMRRLRNVVEEMAIASGVPVPEIYVLEQEEGINAFAAGHSISDAAVAVTQGTLDTLSREELQGVIAHEFSHVLNGDMRINLRLIGLLFGITAIALIGRRVLFHFRYAAGGNRKGGGGIMMVGLALLVIGYTGLFFARWIKAGISRQREVLADASAVQFTRNPQGLGGALKKIAAFSAGSTLATDSEEVDHMLFASGRLERMFATHPPILDRIRAVEPGFQAGELKRVALNLQKQRQIAEAPQRAAKENKPGRAVTDPRAILEGIGQPDWQQILYAAVLAQAIPSKLTQAARAPHWAPALAYYLVLSNDPAQREQQLLQLAKQTNAELEEQVRGFSKTWGIVKPEQRLPLLEMALPALKRRPRRELLEILHTAEDIAPKAGNEQIFPFLLSQVLRLYLEESLHGGATRDSGHLRIRQCIDQASQVLALVASYDGNPHPADAAYESGIKRLEITQKPPFNPPELWSKTLRESIKKLDKLRSQDKERFVEALLAVALHDQKVNIQELELVRAICAVMHVPLPPIQVGAV